MTLGDGIAMAATAVAVVCGIFIVVLRRGSQEQETAPIKELTEEDIALLTQRFGEAGAESYQHVLRVNRGDSDLEIEVRSTIEDVLNDLRAKAANGQPITRIE